MTLEAVQSRGLVDQVFEQLATDIMSGAYPPGAHLPSERALAESLSVNRQVVREASRRLAQVGLVQVLHGDGTRVLDFRMHGGLDLLALLMEQGIPQKRSLGYWWKPILEMRSALAPDVVRHCAANGPKALREEILTVAEQMKREKGQVDLLYELEWRFWDLVHEGADHPVYRFTYNSFKRCAASVREQSKAFTALEVAHSGYRLAVARAIAAGNAARAEREIRASMRATLSLWAQQNEKRAAEGKSKKTTKTTARARTAGRVRSAVREKTSTKSVGAVPSKQKPRAAPAGARAKPSAKKRAQRA